MTLNITIKVFLGLALLFRACYSQSSTYTILANQKVTSSFSGNLISSSQQRTATNCLLKCNVASTCNLITFNTKSSSGQTNCLLYSVNDFQGSLVTLSVATPGWNVYLNSARNIGLIS